MTLAWLLACAGSATSLPTPVPVVAWLAPEDGAELDAGEVAASVYVEDFSLVDLAKHNDGVAMGVLVVAVDGVEVGRFGTTTLALTLAAGEHELIATLVYADGDPVTVAEGARCAEGDEGGCEPVQDVVSVTVD